MKKLDRFTKPYFETRGDKENGVYEVIRYKNDEFIPFKEKFDSLKKLGCLFIDMFLIIQNG
ncbi:hypothetical protein AAHH76_30005 [Bacillus toyonensis]